MSFANSNSQVCANKKNIEVSERKKTYSEQTKQQKLCLWCWMMETTVENRNNIPCEKQGFMHSFMQQQQHQNQI